MKSKGSEVVVKPIPIRPEVVEYFETIKDIDKFQEFPVIEINPFIAPMQNNMNVKHLNQYASDGTGRRDVVDQTTGEVYKDVRFFKRTEEVDSDKFVKIFSGRLRDLFDLSKTAINVFFFILDEMQKPYNINASMIYIDIQACQEFCEYSATKQVYLGLTELLRSGIIAKSHKRHLFYVDPRIAFNGKRMVIVEEYIKKEADFFDDEALKE